MDQGFCLRGSNMAQALRNLGLRVGIATHKPLPGDAPEHLKSMNLPWPIATDSDRDRFMHAWRGVGAPARRRVARYQGRNLPLFAGIIPLADRHRPKTVIALGQHGPMTLKALRDHPTIKRVWYAADEPVSFQLSCMGTEPLRQWPSRLTKAALYAAIECFFARGLDGAVGVSPRDTALLKRIGGVKHTTTIRNGVNLDYFTPTQDQAATPRSLVFWGRMDFEPNIDAALWFAQNVWPTLRQHRPDATWQIVGKYPHPSVQKLAQQPGIEVLGAVPDVRPHARNAAVTILPMRCGNGIKNKLLEAAAMARPIVASKQAVQGLGHTDQRRPAWQCHTPTQWVQAIRRLWADPQASARQGTLALNWVRAHHTWPHAAQQLARWVDSWRTQTDNTTTTQAKQPTIDIKTNTATKPRRAQHGYQTPTAPTHKKAA